MKRLMTYLFGNIIQKLLGNQDRIETKLDNTLLLLTKIDERMDALEKRFNVKDHKDRQAYGHIQYKLQEVSDQTKAPRIKKSELKKAH